MAAVRPCWWQPGWLRGSQWAASSRPPHLRPSRSVPSAAAGFTPSDSDTRSAEAAPAMPPSSSKPAAFLCCTQREQGRVAPCCLCHSWRLPPARRACVGPLARPLCAIHSPGEHHLVLTSQIALSVGKSTPKGPADLGGWLSSRSPSCSLDLMVIRSARSPGCGTQAAMRI